MLWGMLHFVPKRYYVLMVDPSMVVAFTDATKIAVHGRKQRMTQHTTVLASYGQSPRLLRSTQDQLKELWFSGTKFLPERKFASDLQRKV